MRKNSAEVGCRCCPNVITGFDVHHYICSDTILELELLVIPKSSSKKCYKVFERLLMILAADLGVKDQGHWGAMRRHVCAINQFKVMSKYTEWQSYLAEILKGYIILSVYLFRNKTFSNQKLTWCLQDRSCSTQYSDQLKNKTTIVHVFFVKSLSTKFSFSHLKPEVL